VKQGQHEGRENDPEDFRIPDAGQASRGYRDWMGPAWIYQNAYRDGYRVGFRAGYNNESRAWRDRDGDADDAPAVYSGAYGGPWFGDRACQIGFRDGASVGREDKRQAVQPPVATMMKITATATRMATRALTKRNTPTATGLATSPLAEFNSDLPKSATVHFSRNVVLRTVTYAL
jgi:hypothetical protein